MKIIFISLLCLFFAFSAFAQDEKIQELQTVGVEEIYLAKDNGEGKAGEVAENFLTTDIPIYCVVMLDSSKPATVKMNFVAVDVKGVKAETKVLSVSYKTNGKQNRVNFTGKPEGVWTAGNYRIDIFIEGKLAVGKSFEIKKSLTEVQKTPTQVESFVPPKPKPKIVKQMRKN
ncbi:MAG: hypothetical protein ABJA66_11055 [Actinomycetota bacterium]